MFMKEISIKQLMCIAKKLESDKKKWHFHMLTPACFFNEHKDKHAFILENESEKQSFVVYSDKRYMEEGKELVKSLHGNKIIENKKTDLEITDENVKLVLKKAAKLNEQGVSWHHHMLFPNCIFNKHKGQWNITFEDSQENKIIEFLSKDEPKNNLRAIESLFYQQKR